MTYPDYQKMIDAETWDFIRKTNGFYAGSSPDPSVVEQRRTYDRMCAAFRQPRPPGVQCRDDTVAGVRARHYTSAASAGIILYFHGGGFVVGGLDSHDDVCAEICAQTGRHVASIHYRLSPEHRHPAAFDDALSATVALGTQFGPVILAGDSAGASLASSVAHALRGSQTHVAGMVLIYPGLGGDAGSPSMTIHANAPMLTSADIAYYALMRFDGPAPRSDPTALALSDTDFSNLPPTHIFSAECDPLADDGRVYADRIRQAGGQAIWYEDTGLVHGWLRARHSVARAKAAFACIIAALNSFA